RDVAGGKLHPLQSTCNSVRLESDGSHAVILLIGVRRINVLAAQRRGVILVLKFTVDPSEDRVTFLLRTEQGRSVPTIRAVESLRKKTFYSHAKDLR